MVTGAGRGIGRATAIELARLGAKVVVNDIGAGATGEEEDASLAEQVAGEIRAAGGEAAASQDSVSEFESAGRIIATAEEHFGGVDILVNNAGLAAGTNIWDMDPELFRLVASTHVDGTFNCTRHAVGHMKEQGWGRIVNLVSRAGLIGVPGNVAYGAGKGGVFGLTNVMSRDLASFGVTVNGVNPSSTDTRMVSRAIESGMAEGGEGARRAEALKAVLQRPEDVAVVIAALCLDGAAHMSGQFLFVRRSEVSLFQPLTPTRTTSREEPWSSEDLASALQDVEPYPLNQPY